MPLKFSRASDLIPSIEGAFTGTYSWLRQWIGDETEGRNGELAPAPRDREEISADELEKGLLQWIENRQPGLVIGPPGVGKTYNATEAAEKAKDAGFIKDFTILTGHKDMLPDELFEDQLYIDARAAATDRVKSRKSLIKQNVPRKYWYKIGTANGEAKNSEQAMTKWAALTNQNAQEQPWYLIILDEATRCTPTFIDSLLPLLNNFQATLQGKSYFIPVLLILLGNPAGMDASTVAFTHALTSRLHQRLTIYQPGPIELAEIAKIGVLADATLQNVPDARRPKDDDYRLACAIVTLLWGLPLERNGMACLSSDTWALFQAVEREKDDRLRQLLEQIGELVHFGPDPRKARRWLTSALLLAQEEKSPFAISHLVDTAIRCLSVGGKDTFSEGQEPGQQRKKEALTKDIVEHLLLPQPKRWLKDFLTRSPQAADDPGAVAQLFAPPAAPAEAAPAPAEAAPAEAAPANPVAIRLLRHHHTQMHATHVDLARNDDKNHGLKLRAFIGAVVNADLKDTEITTRISESANEHGIASRPAELKYRSDQNFFHELAECETHVALSPAGQALVNWFRTQGVDNRPIPLTVEEKVHLTCLEYPWLNEAKYRTRLTAWCRHGNVKALLLTIDGHWKGKDVETIGEMLDAIGQLHGRGREYTDAQAVEVIRAKCGANGLLGAFITLVDGLPKDRAHKKRWAAIRGELQPGAANG